MVVVDWEAEEESVELQMAHAVEMLVLEEAVLALGGSVAVDSLAEAEEVVAEMEHSRESRPRSPRSIDRLLLVHRCDRRFLPNNNCG